jgi:betaine lipid synthase
MLELKLAGLSSLCYEDFWKLFGEGYIENFSTLLDTHLSPNLSPYAYDFWQKNTKFSNLFKTGCSGLAVRIFNFVIKLRRLQPIVERMCHADTLVEQNSIWVNELRPHLLNKWLIHILNNDRFLWGALGVPPAQMQMLLEEGKD